MITSRELYRHSYRKIYRALILMLEEAPEREYSIADIQLGLSSFDTKYLNRALMYAVKAGEVEWLLDGNYKLAAPVGLEPTMS